MMKAISLWQPWIGLLASLATDGFGYWLAGFADGEGCFVIQGKTSTLQPWFRVKLRDDDAAIVHLIQQRTGIGRVWFRKNGKSKPQVEWIVQKKADCQALVAIFDRFPLRAKKARDFALWRQAVILHAEVRHLGPVKGKPGATRHPHQRLIEELKTQLMDGRKYDESN